MNKFPGSSIASATCITIALLFIFTACKKEARGENEQSLSANDRAFLPNHSGLPAATLQELQQARAASARYRDIRNAIADGYSNIDVVVPNMGHHYLNMDLLDATFDVRKPEILVYNKMEDGSHQLVAVEYAIPLTASASAPSGFTGNHDEWDRNTGFGLWLLHAWVWEYNPAGVFHPTNPMVHTH